MSREEIFVMWNLTEPCDQEAFESFGAFERHILELHNLQSGGAPGAQGR
jgi:hypothetical protein